MHDMSKRFFPSHQPEISATPLFQKKTFALIDKSPELSPGRFLFFYYFD